MTYVIKETKLTIPIMTHFLFKAQFLGLLGSSSPSHDTILGSSAIAGSTRTSEVAEVATASCVDPFSVSALENSSAEGSFA